MTTLINNLGLHVAKNEEDAVIFHNKISGAKIEIAKDLDIYQLGDEVTAQPVWNVTPPQAFILEIPKEDY